MGGLGFKNGVWGFGFRCQGKSLRGILKRDRVPFTDEPDMYISFRGILPQ